MQTGFTYLLSTRGKHLLNSGQHLAGRLSTIDLALYSNTYVPNHVVGFCVVMMSRALSYAEPGLPGLG